MYDYYLKTQRDCTHFSNLRFESRVILDGSQTLGPNGLRAIWFESRVILDGSQTLSHRRQIVLQFESRVVLDGSQTTEEDNKAGISFESRVIFRWVSNSGRYHRRKRRV